ncbi:hypothetical protein [Rothia kristinae]|uniref:hypothetical protein n=1 Tax=Rothia kristinae TaxID=37923 RepID=UPI000AE2914A|nr:hypothetical protein [Rothia kristinae]
MYAWIFRHLPGPLWVRILLAILLVLAVVLALMQWVFPWLAEYSPLSPDVTVDQPDGA